MMCILAVGAVIIIIGIIFLILGLFVLKPQCPFLWEGIQNRCLYVSSHNTSWASAKDFCEEQGGHLADIANIEENNELKEKISWWTWIGFFRPRKKKDFEWVTGASNSFTNFASRPQSTEPGFTECVKMNTDGLWAWETNCNKLFAVACEYQKTYYPFVLIGPVLMVCGIIVLLLSIEVCQRHRRTLDKAKGLIDEEELPNQDDEKDIMKGTPGLINPSFDDTQTPSWRRLSNKTAPETPHIFETAGSSGQTGEEAAESLKDTPRLILQDDLDERDTPKTTARLLSPNDSLSESKSQEQLELLLSPKNLR